MKINEMAWACIDIETTGLNPEKDRIVEVATVWAVSGRICVKHSELFNPGFSIPAAASAIHHIVDEDVEDKAKFDNALFFGGETRNVEFFVAHNAAFEESFLKPLPMPIVCTMRLAQKLWPSLESFSNQFLRYYLKLKPPVGRDESMHRALPDALVTATLFIREIEEVVSSLAIEVREAVPNNELSELLAWLKTPMLLHRIRFGKHGPKDGNPGMLWSEVPRDYLRWLVNNATDMDIDTIHTAKFYLN